MKAFILSASVILLSTLASSSFAAEVVEFHIAPGTAGQPWNEASNPVRVKIGQILRLVNDDSVPHYLHTPGAPCPHGTGPFAPGQTYDCAITSAASPERTIMYDHNYGSTARFFVEATP